MNGAVYWSGVMHLPGITAFCYVCKGNVNLCIVLNGGIEPLLPFCISVLF